MNSPGEARERDSPNLLHKRIKPRHKTTFPFQAPLPMPSSLLMQRPQPAPMPAGSVPFAQQGSQVRPDIPAYNPKFPRDIIQSDKFRLVKLIKVLVEIMLEKRT